LSAYGLTCAGGVTIFDPVENAGYVKVTTFSGTTAEGTVYAQTLQNLMKLSGKLWSG